ncbi:DUF1275 domain-containing protein [Leucobacter rhizosphaerae]|uniref:DUF1275 domain-containing protein n=1 Tax=Leucobacter rhizosphaerae TaxID=2932245 RepID=A0ABY4FXJ6_9MICO|nr:YoaK family protein [Leucobacter rhizosphaerae]UOQ60839.1 DUF1275 domain-containing protein [Leucobacter rhizosphaerae]
MKSLSDAAYGGSVLLAGVAGFVDAIGFIMSGGLFVSFMSGNSTQAGVEVSQGAVHTASVALCLVLGFVLGVTCGHLLGIRFERVRSAERVLILAGALAIAVGIVTLAPTSGYSLVALSAVMGAMNTLFIADGRARVAITYATGTLVSFGIGLAERLSGRAQGSWVRPLLLWTGITLGALVGALTWHLIGLWSLAVAVLSLVAIGGVHLLIRRRSAPPKTARSQRSPGSPR